MCNLGDGTVVCNHRTKYLLTSDIYVKFVQIAENTIKRYLPISYVCQNSFWKHIQSICKTHTIWNAAQWHPSNPISHKLMAFNSKSGLWWSLCGLSTFALSRTFNRLLNLVCPVSWMGFELIKCSTLSVSLVAEW